MKKTNDRSKLDKRILVSIISPFVIIILIFVGCKPPHPEIQYFARALAKDIKTDTCGGKYVKFEPCGQRNVKVDADLGLCVYLNIYGVTDKKEIDELVEHVKRYRGEEYKAIPIEIVFYADLTKSKIIYKEKIKADK